MKRIILILSILFTSVLFAECCCCCCGDGDEDTPDLGGGQTGSCVQMSTEECTAIKNNLRSTVANARSDLAIFETEVVSKSQTLLESMANNVLTEINMAIMYLSQFTSTNAALVSAINSCESSLNGALTFVDSAKDQWSSSVGAGDLFVSNLWNDATAEILFNRNPETVFKTASTRIQNCKSQLQNVLSYADQETELISNAINSMQTAVTAAEEAVTTLTEIQVASETTFNNVTEEINSIEAYAMEINCTACDSGGGGGSGGGTIDLTPLVLAINNLKESMLDQFSKLRELIEKFFDDYKSASGWHVTAKPTYSSYSGTDNWFKRIEMLLFAASGLSVDEEEIEEPETDEITKFKDSVDNEISENSQKMQEHFSEGGKFQEIYKKLTQIFEKFEYLGNGRSDINGPFFHENVQIGDLDFGNVSLPSAVSSNITRVLTMVRYAFQAFYMVFFAFVLFYLIKWTYEEGKDIFMSAMQIYSSLFGGGS